MLKLKRNVVKARPIGWFFSAVSNIYEAVSFWSAYWWAMDREQTDTCLEYVFEASELNLKIWIVAKQ